MMAKMTVDEMIRKFRCELVEKDGKQGVRISGKASKAQIEQLKVAKDELIAELKKRGAVREAKKAAEREKLRLELEGLKNGSIPIQINYHDGEYLMGYEVYGQAAKLLEGIGAAKYISGWGYHVDQKLVEALGKEFTYAAAAKYIRPEHEAVEAKRAQREDELKVKFEEAKATDSPVLINNYMTDCNDPHEECSTDVVSVYAMPDGSERTERQHTW